MNKISFIVGLAILFAGSCKKDEDKPSTTSGTDVVCTVNGKEWKVGKNDSFNIDGNPDNKGAAIVASGYSGSTLNFSIQKWDNLDSAAVVITAVLGDTVEGTYNFNFATDPANKHYIRYIKLDRSSGPPANMENSVGFLKITAHNKVTNEISGEFEAVVTNRNFRGMLSTASISKGKFTNIKMKTP
jgi:hypothetical protein